MKFIKRKLSFLYPLFLLCLLHQPLLDYLVGAETLLCLVILLAVLGGYVAYLRDKC